MMIITTTDHHVILNAFGLGFNMIGTVLILWSSLKNPFWKTKNNTEGASTEPLPKEDPLRPNYKKKKHEMWRIRGGLIILGIGFLLQFIALFC